LSDCEECDWRWVEERKILGNISGYLKNHAIVRGKNHRW
jgi:hypothetical protein